MVVARLVYFAVSDQRILRIRAMTLTRIFVLIDIACFLTQAAGGGIMSNTDSSPNDPLIKIGRNVFIGGCGAQLGFVLLFCGIIARLQVKTAKEKRSGLPLKQVRLLSWAMLAVLLLIVVGHGHMIPKSPAIPHSFDILRSLTDSSLSDPHCLPPRGVQSREIRQIIDQRSVRTRARCLANADGIPPVELGASRTGASWIRLRVSKEREED